MEIIPHRHPFLLIDTIEEIVKTNTNTMVSINTPLSDKNKQEVQNTED